MREFKTLIIDILSDVKRRQGQMLGGQGPRSFSLISDDEPLYDSVASDEDYASVGKGVWIRFVWFHTGL